MEKERLEWESKRDEKIEMLKQSEQALTRIIGERWNSNNQDHAMSLEKSKGSEE